MPKKKQPQKPEKTGVILENSLEDIMADRFGRYAKYIIQDRALPDARDGLKPVQRRILYAMNEAGNTFNKPYHKSAKTVGNVIGNYHPHGDSSVYDAMVRLSQDWKIRLPLIDMQGNNGSIDNDPAAAMRYTECRLSEISSLFMEDIDKDTVEWAPNFSDEKLEPTVLPARFPNLLTLGISGIAAGYATNIPPYNLNEVLHAAIHRLRNPNCSLDELMNYVKGPDFPTGGIVMGKEGIRKVFETGLGKFTIRSKCEFHNTKTIKQIIVTEIPYEVVKSQLVKQIDEIRLNNKVPGILEVRDESDRNGLRIVVDIKPDISEELVLNYLYKNTKLQISYSANTIAIVNQTPKLLSLADCLDAFIAHREDVVTRRSKYDLASYQKRLHIVRGLIKAISVLDEVIKIIRASKNKADSKKNLMDRFGFDDVQAEAIVVLQLYRLSNTDVVELEKERDKLEREIRRLEGILASKKKLDNLICRELEEVNEKFITPRKSRIVGKEETIVIDQAALIPNETVMLSISRDGYIKRSSLRSFSATSDTISPHKQGDSILAQGEANTKEYLLVFTDKGKYGYLPVYSIAESKWKDLGTHISKYIRMDTNEKVIDAYLVKEFYKGVSMIMLSKGGMIKRTALSEFESSRINRMMVAMKIGDLDELAAVLPSRHMEDQVVLATQDGYGLRYPLESVPENSLKTKGVRGVNVAANDHAVDLAIENSTHNQFLLWQQDGQMKRLHTEDFPQVNRPAKGNRLFKTVKSNPAKLFHMENVSHEHQLLFEMDEPTTLAAAKIPFIAPTHTWSSPVGKQEMASLVKPLKRIKDGDWKEENEDEQPSLLGGEDE